MATITPSIRVGRTPFTQGVEVADIKSYTVYNHTLLASQFASYVDDYHHLKRHVQIWDVTCQKQVRVKGIEAQKLLQLISPRDISKMFVGQCLYVPVIDSHGGMLNDPVILKLSSDEYWISLADSDYIQYALGVAGALGINVDIDHPDVYPLAVQGPKADELVSRVFGNSIRKIRFFNFGKFKFQGEDMIVSRSGYSKQGGFEIYVSGTNYAMPLWNTLLEKGEDLNVKVGCPNLIERIEGGLLSYGNDISRQNTPFEVGLGKFVNSPFSFIGKENLLNRPFVRMIRPLSIIGEIPPCDRVWPAYLEGKKIGQVTSAIYSPDFSCNVAIGMIENDFAKPRTRIEIETQIGIREAFVEKAFWS